MAKKKKKIVSGFGGSEGGTGLTTGLSLGQEAGAGSLLREDTAEKQVWGAPVGSSVWGTELEVPVGHPSSGGLRGVVGTGGCPSVTEGGSREEGEPETLGRGEASIQHLITLLHPTRLS